MRPTLVIIALFLSTASNATPLRAHQPRSEPIIAGYDYVGCYSDSTSKRALTDNAYFDDAMTVEKCAAACSGFTWFGVEYGRECYCGNSIDAGSVSKPENDCSFTCPGDGLEFCGAGDRLNLYSVTKAPSSKSAVRRYSFQGCYNDPAQTGNPRAISDHVYYDDDLTVEKCQAACAGYTYFGIEYGRECYCGNALTPGTTQVSTAYCGSHMCNGDTTEPCGGDWQLDLYALVPIAEPTSSTSTSTTASATSTATGTAFQGCYNEPSNGRALTGHVFYDDDMTTEKCGTACAGFTYFGIEYGRECYCGNVLADGATQASPSPCDTHMCVGDGTESCGGNWQLDLYKTAVTPFVSTFTSQGCYTEATNERALSDAVYFDDAMTVEKCAAYCAPGQPTWFGIEYGRECYCGSRLHAGSVQTSSSDCSFQCPGDSSEYCGAGNRLNMYQYGTTVTTTSASSSAMSTSSTMSTTDSSTSSSTTQSSTSTSATTASSIGTTSTTTSDTTSSTTSMTSTISTASTTSSTTSTTSTSTSTLMAPACATPLSDPGFEETNPSAIPWIIKQPTTLTKVNFMDTDTTTGSLHGGAQQASISYAAGYNTQAWFSQPIKVCPNTQYNLSAWVRRKVINDFCTVYFYIGSADANSVVSILNQSRVFTLDWSQATASWTSGTTLDLTFNVRTTCPLDAYQHVGQYIDDIVFEAES